MKEKHGKRNHARRSGPLPGDMSTSTSYTNPQLNTQAVAPCQYPESPTPSGYPVPQRYPYPQASPSIAAHETAEELQRKKTKLRLEDQEWFLQKMVASQFQYSTESDPARVKFFEDLATEAGETRGLLLDGFDVRRHIHYDLCSKRRMLLKKGQLPSRRLDDSRLLLLQDKWNRIVLGAEQKTESYADKEELERLESFALKKLLRHFDVLEADESAEADKLDAKVSIAALVNPDTNSIIPSNVKARLIASTRSPYLSPSGSREVDKLDKKQLLQSSVGQGQVSRKRCRGEDESDNETSDIYSESDRLKRQGTCANHSHDEGPMGGLAGAATRTTRWVQAHGVSQSSSIPSNLGLVSRENLKALAGPEVAESSRVVSSAEQSQVAEQLESTNSRDEGGVASLLQTKDLHELAAFRNQQKQKAATMKAKNKAQEKRKKKWN